MTTALEEVEAAALRRPAAQRAELIERLIDTVLPAPTLHPAWEAEIARRLVDFDSGLVETSPMEDVMAELRAKIDAHERKA